jgi:hypothetical protein
MRWRVIASGLAFLAICASMAPAAAGQAGSAGQRRVPATGKPVRAGFIWSGDTSGFYIFSSSGGGASSSFDGTPNGGHVLFPGLPLRPAFIQITSYSTSDTCRDNGFAVSHGTLLVNTWCDDNLTAAANDEYDVLVVRPSPRTRGVFDVARAGSGRPGGVQAFYNSSGGRTRWRRLGVGRYQLTLPGPATRGSAGIVMLTAWVFRNCVLAGWRGSPAGQVVGVDCYAFSGRPTDRGAVFDLSYVRGTNLMGLNGLTTANAYASRPDAVAPYQPADQYDSAHGARVTVQRQSVGDYKVTLTGSGGPYLVNGGDVQISAVSRSDVHCSSGGWSQQANPVAYVRCWTNGGVAVDSRFTFAWVVA